jgi:hypothetical protein
MQQLGGVFICGKVIYPLWAESGATIAGDTEATMDAKFKQANHPRDRHRDNGASKRRQAKPTSVHDTKPIILRRRLKHPNIEHP